MHLSPDRFTHCSPSDVDGTDAKRIKNTSFCIFSLPFLILLLVCFVYIFHEWRASGPLCPLRATESESLRLFPVLINVFLFCLPGCVFSILTEGGKKIMKSSKLNKNRYEIQSLSLSAVLSNLKPSRTHVNRIGWG